MSTLFDEIVQRTGLGRMVAPFTVSRLLVKARVDPKKVTPEGLKAALPEFERGLAVYLADEELERAMRDLRELAAS